MFFPTIAMTNPEVPSPQPSETTSSDPPVRTIDQLVTDAEHAVMTLENLGSVQDQRPATWPRAIVYPHPIRDRWWFTSTGVDFGRIPEAKTAENAYEAANIGVRSAIGGRNSAEALLSMLEDLKRRLQSITIELPNGEPH